MQRLKHLEIMWQTGLVDVFVLSGEGFLSLVLWRMNEEAVI
jgi:hypothetical protein